MFKSPRPDQFHPERRAIPPVRPGSPSPGGIAGLTDLKESHLKDYAAPILAIGFNITGIVRLPVGNLLPAILFTAAFGGRLG